MKKLILVTIFLILSNASLSLGNQFRSNWGVVISVIPIFTTTNYSQPNTKVFCNKSRQSQSSNFANIAVGGLIGSVSIWSAVTAILLLLPLLTLLLIVLLIAVVARARARMSPLFVVSLPLPSL